MTEAETAGEPGVGVGHGRRHLLVPIQNTYAPQNVPALRRFESHVQSAAAAAYHTPDADIIPAVACNKIGNVIDVASSVGERCWQQQRGSDRAGFLTIGVERSSDAWARDRDRPAETETCKRLARSLSDASISVALVATVQPASARRRRTVGWLTDS